MTTAKIGRSRQQTNEEYGTCRRFECHEDAGRVLRLLLLLVLPSCAPETGYRQADTSDGAGSSGTPSVAEPIDTAAFAAAFEVVREIVLEENDQAMVVQPTVSSGGDGLLLLAEPMEGQVNVFGTDGTFKTVLGGKGEAPGELQFPLTAHRSRSGEIVVADIMLPRITFYPPDEGDRPEVVRAPFPATIGAQDLGNGRYIVAGADPSQRRPRLLHIWNRESGSIERSFLPVGVPEALLSAAASFIAASATLEGDTIWAVWALSDTLYKFDRSGGFLAALPLPLPRPGDLEALTGGPRDARNMQSAFDAVTRVYKVFVLDNGDKVIVSMQRRGFDGVWDILILDRQGDPVWKAANMPRLMTVEDGLFYFQHPGSSLPNRWVVARRKVQ